MDEIRPTRRCPRCAKTERGSRAHRWGESFVKVERINLPPPSPDLAYAQDGRPILPENRGPRKSIQESWVFWSKNKTYFRAPTLFQWYFEDLYIRYLNDAEEKDSLPVWYQLSLLLSSRPLFSVPSWQSHYHCFVSLAKMGHCFLAKISLKIWNLSRTADVIASYGILSFELKIQI